MERKIRVIGEGNISVKPDTIRLILTIESKQKDYEKLLKESSDKTEEIKDLCSKLGIDRKEVKTISFDVDTHYKDYQNTQKLWKRKFEGYKFEHVLNVEFAIDNEKLGKFLHMLSELSSMPHIDIEYTVKKPEKYKDLLLENAMIDSKHKADVLTKVAGVKLGNVVTIDYSWEEISFVSNSRRTMKGINSNMYSAQMRGAMPDITPNDIKIKGNITVVWEII